MDQASTGKVLCMLTCLPNGIQAMSAEIPGLVQTSLNLGILVTEGDEVQASFSVRSSVDSQKQMLKDRLVCLTEQLGGHRWSSPASIPAGSIRRTLPCGI